MSVLCALGGCVWLFGALGVFAPSPALALSFALSIVGCALIVGAWFGHARRLVFLAVPLTMMCAISAVLDVPLHGGVGSRNVRPSSISEITGAYEQAVGHLTIDLTGLTGPVSITAREGIGQIEVVVPQDADVVVEAHVGVGVLNLLDVPSDGGYHRNASVHTLGKGVRIEINARLGVGEIRIRRSFDEVSVEPTTTSATSPTASGPSVTAPTVPSSTPTTTGAASSPTGTTTSVLSTSTPTSASGSIRHTMEMYP